MDTPKIPLRLTHMSVDHCYKQYVGDGMETSLPKGRNVIGGKWVYVLKEHAKNEKEKSFRLGM